ncbi:unnamed protein product [Sphagnum troendelagicum]
MGLKGDIKSRQVSGGEGGSSKGAAKAGSSTQQSGGSKKDVHQDPSQDLPQDGSQDGSQRLPERSSILPSNSEEKKVLVVSVYPLWGYVREGYGGQEIHEGHQLFDAAIVPVLQFRFEVEGDQKKITTILNSQCNLGQCGGPNVNPRNLGYLQDNITISLKNSGRSLVYNFLYPEEVEACIADAQQGPRQLIALGIGGTFAPTIIGEWDALDESRTCKYRFETQRDISSIENIRQSRGPDPQRIQQRWLTKELDVEVREIGEHAWKGLWEDQGCEELELLEIILPEPETKVGGSLNTGLEDELERFGIGLTKSDVLGMYAENHLEQLKEGFFPLIYDLVEYMGLEGENSIRCRQVSGGEGGSSKDAAKVRCSTEKSGGKKDVHQGPSQDPPEDGSQDGFQGPPQGPPQGPSEQLAMEGKKTLLVSIFPLRGYLSHGPGGQEIHDSHELYQAAIVPVLKFMFEVDGGQRKITTTLILTCDLGVRGGLVDWRGEIHVPFLGIQAGGGDGQTNERGSSFAHETLGGTQLSRFHVTSKCRGSSLAYKFLYPIEVQANIADEKQGPRELITSEIGGTFEPTIVDEWDGLDQSKKCSYIFKTERDITSIEGLRQSHGSGEEPECIKHPYELPLWVNHSMKHILHRHEIKEL